MSTMDRETVEKVAHLARLKLTDSEIQKISEQISAVLENFKELQAVDTDGVEPLVTPTEMSMTLRDDVVKREVVLDEIMANAPQRAGNLFKVPPVV